MFAPAPILKNARDRDPQPPSPPDDAPRFLGGVIRDARTRTVRPCPVDGPQWTSDFPVAESAAKPAAEPAAPASIDVDALRATWEAEAAARAEAEREAAVAEAREAAYAEGYAAAEADLAATFEAEREASRQALDADAARLRALWDERLADAEPHLVGLAVDVAEALLDGPLDADQQAATASALTAAIERLADRPPLVVALHPVDHLRLQETGLTEALSASHPGLRWVPEPGLAEGDWSLDADGAALRHVRAEVLRDLRLRLGLLPDTEPAP
jgi:flagellar biosynthesis/type III secretory pathway protein FliH